MIKHTLNWIHLWLPIVFMFSCFGNAFSQQILSGGGNSVKNSTAELTWTIGEPCIETLNSTTAILTQGFNQSRLIVTDARQITETNIEITVFPNPTAESITIQIERYENKNYLYQVYDCTGKLVLMNKIEMPSLNVSLRDLPPATYLLKVLEKNNELKTFKIIKNKD